jgi:hypothetical protein
MKTGLKKNSNFDGNIAIAATQFSLCDVVFLKIACLPFL